MALQALNNLKTSHYLLVKWEDLGADTRDLWGFRLAVTLPSAGVLTVEHRGRTKNAAKESCAQEIIPRIQQAIQNGCTMMEHVPPIQTEQHTFPSIADFEISTKVINLDQPTKGPAAPSVASLEEIIMEVLRGFGSQAVTAKEIQRRVTAQGYDFTKYDNSSKSTIINRKLYDLLSGGKVRMSKINDMTYWMNSEPAQLQTVSNERPSTIRR
jgi:hypothetical protein